MKVFLLYPRSPETFWGFRHALKFVRRKASFPPLGLLTVAAMLPPSWSKRLVDENVRGVTAADLAWADVVFVRAMIVQRESARALREVREHLLPALIAWQRGKRGISFFTQASINLADDGALMEALVGAGFRWVIARAGANEDENQCDCEHAEGARPSTEESPREHPGAAGRDRYCRAADQDRKRSQAREKLPCRFRSIPTITSRATRR